MAIKVRFLENGTLNERGASKVLNWSDVSCWCLGTNMSLHLCATLFFCFLAFWLYLWQMITHRWRVKSNNNQSGQKCLSILTIDTQFNLKLVELKIIRHIHKWHTTYCLIQNFFFKTLIKFPDSKVSWNYSLEATYLNFVFCAAWNEVYFIDPRGKVNGKKDNESTQPE